MSDDSRGIYAQWAASIEALGGVATNWPFSTGVFASAYGQPAARFPSATYAMLFNAGHIDASAPQQANPDNTYVYVLASGVIQQAAAALPQPTVQEINAGATSWLESHGLPSPDVFDAAKYVMIGGVALAVLVGLSLVRGRR